MATIQPDLLLIEERLAQHSLKQTNLFEELTTMTPLNLEQLAYRFREWNHPAASEMIYDGILAKCRFTAELTEGQEVDTLRYAVYSVRTMVLQHKFWTANMVLKGICMEHSFHVSSSSYQLQITKLALITSIGEHLEEPRDFEDFEGQCAALIKQQDLNPFDHKDYRPVDLILAYLLHLYGIKDRVLDGETIARVERVLRAENFTEIPLMSSVWVGQQYVRWCLRNMQYKSVTDILDNLERVSEKLISPDSPEAALNKYLRQLFENSIRLKTAETGPPHIVDVYKVSQADETWLKLFRQYLYVWDEPDRDRDQTRRTKAMDGYYYT